MIMSVRLWLMGGSMPLFSEQDNPASFSPHLLIRSVSNSHAHTMQTQTHQLSTFPVNNSGNRKKAKQNSSELANNFATQGSFHSILLSLYVVISCEHRSWFKFMFSFKFDHTDRLLPAARQTNQFSDWSGVSAGGVNDKEICLYQTLWVLVGSRKVWQS